MNRIRKILNSNVVLVDDDEHNSFIIMGRGLGYGKKQGDIVQDSDQNQIFIPLSDSKQQAVLDLFNQLPQKVFELSEQIIRHAEKELERKLNVSVHLALADHIHFAIERCRQGLTITNRVLWEIKTFYRQEFAIGQYGVALLNEAYRLTLPEEEAANIAFHIANAESEAKEGLDSMQSARLIREIKDIVLYSLNRTVDEDSLHYARFIMHTRFFAERLLTGKQLPDSGGLYELFHGEYTDCMPIVDKIEAYLRKKYQIIITREEKIFLAIHIKRMKAAI